MHLEFSYNKEDVVNALRYHFLNRGEVKVFRNTLIILLIATLAGHLFRVVTMGALIGIVAMIFVIAWVFWYLLPISTYNKATTFKDNIHLVFSDEGMSISTRIREHQRQIPWTSFSQVVETRLFFYLYRDKKSFFLIPVSAFETAHAKEHFTALVKEKIG